MWSLFCDQKGSKMPTFIQTILTAIKGASLTAKIVGVATAVVVVGGTTAVIIVQSNSSNQESQNTEADDNPNDDVERVEAEDKEETKTQDENSDSSDNQENGTSEQSKIDNAQTSNSGTSKPSNSSQSSSSSQSTTSQPVVQPQPTTPKAEFNLNDSILAESISYSCLRFLGGDPQDSSNYVTAPDGGWIDILSTGQRFTRGRGYPASCPEGYEHQGGGYGPKVLNEETCNLFNLSCDRW